MANDDDALHAFDKRMAQVLVEMDISRGLPVELDIQWGSRVYT